jgi:hypothetical protein
MGNTLSENCLTRLRQFLHQKNSIDFYLKFRKIKLAIILIYFMSFNSFAQVHLDNPLYNVNKQLRNMFSPLTRVSPYNSVNYLGDMAKYSK